MDTMGIKTLRVPGATLAYAVQGSGPLLLLMPGGGNHARAFAGIVPYLVDQYTVVTYSRRGLGPSTLDDPQEVQQVATQSDDAARLLQAVGPANDPALVFGSSGGAIVGLDLVARYRVGATPIANAAHAPGARGGSRSARWAPSSRSISGRA